MRSLLPIVLRDVVTRLLLVGTALGAAGFVIDPAGSPSAATATAARVVWLVVAPLGGLVAASAWGSADAAGLEENAHLSGQSSHHVRLRLFLLVQLVVAICAVVLIVVALGAARAAPKGTAHLPGPDDTHPGTTVLLLLLAPTAVALGTVLGRGRSRAAALAVALPALLLPLVVQFGPRLSGRELVLALSPTGAAAVLPGAAGQPPAVRVLSAMTLAAVWVGCAAELGRSPAQPAPRRGSVRTLRLPVLKWGWAAALVSALVVVAGAGPVLGERVDYSLRYAATVQANRQVGPEETVRAFVDLAASGRLTSANRLTASGDAAHVLSALPANAAGALRGAPMRVASSPSIRSADVELTAGGATFHACLDHPRRAWLIERIAGGPCG